MFNICDASGKTLVKNNVFPLNDFPDFLYDVMARLT